MTEQDYCYDNKDGCAEMAEAIYRDLTEAQPYFAWVCATMTQVEWSPKEEEMLSSAWHTLLGTMGESADPKGDHHQLAMPTMGANHNKRDARKALSGVLAAARSVLEWAELREVVLAAELRTKGAKAEEI